MYQAINGYTKKKMMETIKKYNNGTKAVTALGCVYNRSDGNRCAVGCFIPDERIESVGSFGGFASGLIMRFPDLANYMPLEPYALDLFQQIHDKSDDHEDLHSKLFKWIEENIMDRNAET